MLLRPVSPFRRRLLAQLAFAVGLWVGGASAVEAQFAIDELELHITAEGMEPITRVFPIRSTLDTVQQVQLQVQDWYRDSVGGNLFVEYGSQASSCKGRLDVFPMTLQLGPGATEFVRLTYTPVASDPGCWAIVMAERVRPPNPEVPGSSVSIAMRTGVKLYVHQPGAASAGSVISADIEESWERRSRADSSLVRDVVVRFENTGTAHLRVLTSLELRDAATQLIQRVAGPDAYITPGAFRDILIRVPALPAGRYLAVVLLDYGGDEITAAQVEFSIP